MSRKILIILTVVLITVAAAGAVTVAVLHFRPTKTEAVDAVAANDEPGNNDKAEREKPATGNGTVIGYVVDKSRYLVDQNNKITAGTISEATITLEKTGSGFVSGEYKTDRNGRFELELPPGEYAIIVSVTGYDLCVLHEVTVESGQINNLKEPIQMIPLGEAAATQAPTEATASSNNYTPESLWATLVYNSWTSESGTALKITKNNTYYTLRPNAIRSEYSYYMGTFSITNSRGYYYGHYRIKDDNELSLRIETSPDGIGGTYSIENYCWDPSMKKENSWCITSDGYLIFSSGSRSFSCTSYHASGFRFYSSI